jgi:hypothetical protein
VGEKVYGRLPPSPSVTTRAQARLPTSRSRKDHTDEPVCDPTPRSPKSTRVSARTTIPAQTRSPYLKPPTRSPDFAHSGDDGGDGGQAKGVTKLDGGVHQARGQAPLVLAHAARCGNGKGHVGEHKAALADDHAPEYEGEAPVSDISVISSTPAPISTGPVAATGFTPRRVTSRPATIAAGTEETVMGAKRRPAASGQCASTSWK